jgi:hypothetical protein
MNQSLQSVLRHLEDSSPSRPAPLEDDHIQPVHHDDQGHDDPGFGVPHAEEESGDDPGLWQTPPPMPGPDPFDDASAAAEGLPALALAPSSHEFIEGLPPGTVLTELATIFFELIYPWCPLFHQDTFMAQLLSPERELLLHGLVVVAFRFWTGPEPASFERPKQIAVSRERILLAAINSCTIVSTQALALLAVDALGEGTGPRAWNTMSLLATAARHLGLATNPALSKPVTAVNTPMVRNDDDDETIFPSVVEVEEKARLFWVICSLDRFSSVAHGQPGGILTGTIKMPYPKSDSHWEEQIQVPSLFDGSTWVTKAKANDSNNLWHQYIDLLGLADRCNQLLIQPVNLFELGECQRWQDSFRELDKKLTLWHGTLPEEVKNVPGNFDPMWYLFQANFHLIRIRMYTVAAYPSSASPHVRASTSAQARCRSSVKDVADMVRLLQDCELDRLGPNFAFVLWVASRSLVILSTTGYESSRERTNNDMQPLLNALRHLGRQWPSAARYSELVQLVLDTQDSPGGPSYLQIFNDTKKTAYGLERCLGAMAQRRKVDIQPNAFDFLDLPVLDAAEISTNWMDGLGLDV